MKRLSVLAGVAMLLGMAAMTLTASSVAAVAYCYGEEATITGSGTINGTSKADVIVGSAGADVIKGNGGNDLICAGDGADTVNGNSGDDLIFGEGGADKLAGDAGNDVIFGDAASGDAFETDLEETGWDGYYPETDCATDQPGFGADTLLGGSGNDTLIDVCGNNTADGGNGNDIIEVSGTGKGGAGNDPIVWAYNDYYDGGGYDALADGGSGNDGYVYAYVGTAMGGSGNDEVYIEESGEAQGGSGNDIVGDWDDAFVLGLGGITLNGGSGRDTCITEGDDELISCERVEGTV